MGIYTTFGNLVHDTALDFGPRLAEAQFRPASTKATISGQYHVARSAKFFWMFHSFSRRGVEFRGVVTKVFFWVDCRGG